MKKANEFFKKFLNLAYITEKTLKTMEKDQSKDLFDLLDVKTGTGENHIYNSKAIAGDYYRTLKKIHYTIWVICCNLKQDKTISNEEFEKIYRSR